MSLDWIRKSAPVPGSQRISPAPASLIHQALSSGSGGDRILPLSLLVYALAAGFFSFAQRDYINADFVAYATIAHRYLAGSPAAISAAWSPLFSWLLMPWLALGVPDPLAGRLVLVLFGAAYIVAVSKFSARIWRTESRFTRGGMLAAAVLQATLWSTYLLDPDLIAAFFLFVYLTLTAGSVPARSVGAGVAAGFAFLSKAYLLPFVLVHLIATLAFRRTPLRAVAGALAGLLMVAGPWIGTLSRHYRSFTISSAGSSNHANLAPDVYGQDLLWKPGLVADYIVDPKLGPDWSPLQDGAHFQHQLALLLKNSVDFLSAMSGWLSFLVVSLFIYWRQGPPEGATQPALDQSRLLWLSATGLVYLGGYLLVQVQPRYLEPFLVPLCCVIGLSFLSCSAVSKLGSRVAIILIFPFALQDGFRLWQVAAVHPQSVALPHFRDLATKIQQMSAVSTPMACNRWHDGLYLAYAAGQVASYLGSPKAETLSKFDEQLNTCGALCYLRWTDRRHAGARVVKPDAFVPSKPWKKFSTFEDTPGAVVELYRKMP
ncbi:MAG: hypothetical protein ABI839_00055 [Verrucomicrobiota bacterium]